MLYSRLVARAPLRRTTIELKSSVNSNCAVAKRQELSRVVELVDSSMAGFRFKNNNDATFCFVCISLQSITVESKRSLLRVEKETVQDEHSQCRVALDILCVCVCLAGHLGRFSGGIHRSKCWACRMSHSLWSRALANSSSVVPKRRNSAK